MLSSEGRESRVPNQLFYQNPLFQADKSVYWPPNGSSIFFLYFRSCLLLFLNNLYFLHHLSESSCCLLHDDFLNTVTVWKFYVLYSFPFNYSTNSFSLVPSVKPGLFLYPSSLIFFLSLSVIFLYTGNVPIVFIMIFIPLPLPIIEILRNI